MTRDAIALIAVVELAQYLGESRFGDAISIHLEKQGLDGLEP